jgi:hypothetical protein
LQPEVDSGLFKESVVDIEPSWWRQQENEGLVNLY